MSRIESETQKRPSDKAVYFLRIFTHVSGPYILKKLERAKGIEPSYAAWEAAVLPLNYARVFSMLNRRTSFVKPLPLAQVIGPEVF